MAVLILATALTLSTAAAYYSIVGLIAIFAAAAIPVAIMGSALEVAKLVTASWLYNYWTRIPKMLKTYLCIAVVVLMFVTSMGIFGFLSKAHLDQTVPTGDVAAKVAIIDEKIKTEKDNIEAARKALKQMDDTVDQTIARSKDERGATNAANLRRNQAKERTQLQKDISTAQANIAKLNEERAPIAAELRKVEAEVGPIKYIAKFIYNDEPDANILEKAVTWVIIVLIFVFDPLAVLLVIAGNMTWKWAREENTPSVKEIDNATTDSNDVLDNNNDKGVDLGNDRSDPVPIADAKPQEPISGDLTSPERFGLKKEPTITLDMPGTIGGATVVLPEAEPAKEETFAPPGTPGEAWDTPVQVNSEQQDNSNLDKIYKASAEELAKQKRSRGWFNAVFPKRDNN